MLNHLECLNGIANKYRNKYQSFLFFAEFNAGTNEIGMTEFLVLNVLASLNKTLTCFKSPDKPTCIDLILTNRLNCFQLSNVFETGLFEFNLLTVTNFKSDFQKLPPKIVTYSDGKFRKLRPSTVMQGVYFQI